MNDKIYSYKGNSYMTLGTLKVKHPDTGVWFDAIRYEGRDGEQYGRETEDFVKKFKEEDEQVSPGIAKMHLKNKKQDMLAIYKFHVDCGRMGDLEGVFVAEQDAVKNIIGTEVYFGEVLGKHSEIVKVMTSQHFTEVTTDPRVTEVFVQHDLGSGFNPFDYIYDGDEDYINEEVN
jgi:hypothetical protein